MLIKIHHVSVNAFMMFRIFLLYFNKSLKIAKANEKKDRQFFGQRKKANNDLWNPTQKTNNWATRTPQETKRELRCSRRAINSCCTNGTNRLTWYKPGDDSLMRGTNRIVMTTNGIYFHLPISQVKLVLQKPITILTQVRASNWK